MLFLIDVYTDWCKSQKLPRMSADDLLYGADTQGKLNLNQRNWLERKLDEYNHTMELFRTILPFLILLLQIYILTKLI